MPLGGMRRSSSTVATLPQTAKLSPTEDCETNCCRLTPPIGVAPAWHCTQYLPIIDDGVVGGASAPRRLLPTTTAISAPAHSRSATWRCLTPFVNSLVRGDFIGLLCYSTPTIYRCPCHLTRVASVRRDGYTKSAGLIGSLRIRLPVAL